jgi:hypothetical protein
MPVGRLVEEGLVDAAKLGLVRKYDGLINYMYLPPHPKVPQMEFAELQPSDFADLAVAFG